MTKSTITRERLAKIKSWRETYGAGSNVMLPAEEAEELARIALAAKDREQVRREHAEWSQATFGNVGPVGPLKHLSKEALEAAAEPGDLSEWADMQFLLWGAQRRAGVTDEQITQAMIEKLAVNKQREWPEPKDGEPRLHIKAQPAPIASVCTCPSGDGSLRWPCLVHPGNSPAQSYCCPAQNSVSPAQNGNSLVIPNEMTSEQAYEIGYYYGDPVNVFARGANWMRQHIIDSTLAAAQHDTPALNSVQSVVTVPGKWIPVSERMPEVGDIVLTAMGWVVNVGETECSAANCRFFTSVISGRELPATHWMQLPAAPQEVGDA